jgi:hypothetical protein
MDMFEQWREPSTVDTECDKCNKCTKWKFHSDTTTIGGLNIRGIYKCITCGTKCVFNFGMTKRYVGGKLYIKERQQLQWGE